MAMLNQIIALCCNATTIHEMYSVVITTHTLHQIRGKAIQFRQSDPRKGVLK